ncbi:MAG: HEAT repeat domain-containing protein [Chlamydiota bacterium]
MRQKVAALIIAALYFCTLIADENKALERITAQLLVRDHQAALKECQVALKRYADSRALQRALIQVLGHQGKEEHALKYWKSWRFSPKESDLIESIAWGILEQSDESSELMIPFAALLSAAATNDVRVVAMLGKQLTSPNAFLRSVAAKIAANYWDPGLIEHLKTMLKEEQVWFVRLEVIGALGAMEVKEAKEALEKIAISTRSSPQEKVAAIGALLSIYETVGAREFDQLFHSKWAGLRQLACDIVAHLDWKEKRFAIEVLLGDSSSDVRIAALNTLYLLGLNELDAKTLEKIKALIADPNPFVAITASWIVLRFDPAVALAYLRRQLSVGDDAVRRFAAFAVAHGGAAGLPLAQKALKTSLDPFVRINIALGLAEYGQQQQAACNEIYTFLTLHSQRIMWEDSPNPLFKSLGPTKLYHIAQIPSYPLTVDQLTRLEMFTLLATLGDDRAEAALRSFLSRPLLGVTYAAANALVEEGGEETFTVLRRLLNDDCALIRVQAALVLALTEREQAAIDTLQDAYAAMDRDMKINILGALGHIGSCNSIPFLLERLEEPYQVLKVVAAAALVQCLYH